MSVHAHTSTERQKAMARALKMAVLFNTKHFDNVMDAVYKPNYDNFKKFCGKDKQEYAQLELEEIDWLWNYLSKYNDGKTSAAGKYSATIGW